MRPNTYYEVELSTASAKRSSLTSRLLSEREVLALARKAVLPGSEFFVACVGKDVDFGNLIIDVDSRGVAEVRSLEHQSFIARGLSREQALLVLQYWLPRQERSQDVEWEAD